MLRLQVKTSKACTCTGTSGVFGPLLSVCGSGGLWQVAANTNTLLERGGVELCGRLRVTRKATVKAVAVVRSAGSRKEGRSAAGGLGSKRSSLAWCSAVINNDGLGSPCPGNAMLATSHHSVDPALLQMWRSVSICGLNCSVSISTSWNVQDCPRPPEHSKQSHPVTRELLTWQGMHWWAAEQRKPPRDGSPARRAIQPTDTDLVPSPLLLVLVF